MNILDKIIEHKKEVVSEAKKNKRISTLEKSEYYNLPTLSIKNNLLSQDFGIIAEFKRKSPSRGEIMHHTSPLEVAKIYESANVAGMSILTDSKYFNGAPEDLSVVKKNLAIPLLRKDFIIDEYQIFEAKSIGADCILLIAEILDKKQLLEFAIIAKSLGMEVLMELHSVDQLSKINDEVDILGVNNRNLKRQKTDIQTSINLFDFLPKDLPKISESGIFTSDDIQILSERGFQGALIGTSILESESPKDYLNELKSKIKTVKI